MSSLRAAACLLAGVWCVLAGGLALAGRSGSAGHDAALVATFALAAALVWSVAPGGADGRRTGLRGPAAGALALAAGFAAFPAWMWLCLHFGLALGLTVEDLGLPRLPLADRGLVLVGVLGLAPLFEEKLYRGHLLGVLRPRLGTPLAVLVTSALFAASHLLPWTMAGVFLFGLVLGALRSAGGSLALCIGLHAGVNTAAVACGIPPVQWALPLGASAAIGLPILTVAFAIDRQSRAEPRPGGAGVAARGPSACASSRIPSTAAGTARS